jgi:hypothetical protein
MEKIYEIEKKKIEVIGAPPSDWPWFEGFDNIFFGTAKINGILNAIDQGVRVMNSKTKVVNVSDEEDVQTPWMPSSRERQLLCLGMTMKMLKSPHLLFLIALKLGHVNYLVCKGNLIRS